MSRCACLHIALPRCESDQLVSRKFLCLDCGTNQTFSVRFESRAPFDVLCLCKLDVGKRVCRLSKYKYRTNCRGNKLRDYKCKALCSFSTQ